MSVLPNTENTYYQIAVPSPLRRTFDYLPPETASETTLLPGTRVVVSFGRRDVTGLVVAVSHQSELPDSKLKPISQVLDKTPLIPAQLFEQYLWAANYYQHPIGDALLGMLPSLLRKGETIPSRKELRWRLSGYGLGLPEGALKRAPKQQQLLTLLQQRESVNRIELDQQGISRDALRSLEKKALVESFEVEPVASNEPEENLLGESPLKLYPAQQKVLEQVELHGFNSYLLQGETGSGKTEIYLQAIEKVLRYGRQALVLVPEISLTPQTVSRFQKRFNRPLAVLHSGLTGRERAIAWDMARTGEAPIVIGTRSAIFTPLNKPGILIVDEEHDPSFKQQEGFRYHARDLAVMRAHREQVPVVLGSATPALESLHNARQGRYHRLKLVGRPGSAKPPRWQVLDIRKQSLNAGISLELSDAIGRELKAGNQVLVFLNRRGFAPTLMCHDCGWLAECRRCDVRMTVHRGDSRLVCHHCDQQQRIPPHCPNCFSNQLQYLGQGTERGELELEALFPDYPVIRVDRDTTRRKQAMQQVVDEVAKGEPCILLGTQILAKGHHFPDVTLVAILDADGGLFSSDFRGSERMGQLITQVAGRSGRGDKPGRVILQTHHSEHPLIELLSQSGYGPFAEALMAERQMAAMPPYRYMALIRAEAGRATDAENFLFEVRQQAETLVPADNECSYLGPFPASMERRAGRYRYQLSLNFQSRSRLQQLLATFCEQVSKLSSARKVRWSVDVDPQDML